MLRKIRNQTQNKRKDKSRSNKGEQCFWASSRDKKTPTYYTADTLCSAWDFNFVFDPIRGGGIFTKNYNPENSSKAFKVFAADWLNDFHWTRTPCLWLRGERKEGLPKSWLLTLTDDWGLCGWVLAGLGSPANGRGIWAVVVTTHIRLIL